MMKFPRASGILLHPTSLPGRFGIGDLGPEAHSFVDFLNKSGQRYWQILPLGPTGYGDSPYQSFSAFAGNTLLISPEAVVEDGLVSTAQIEDVPGFPNERVDFGGVFEWKNKFLRVAFDGLERGSAQLKKEFEVFQNENAWWLGDYALYKAAKAFHGQKPWYEWPEPIKSRDDDAVAAAKERLFTESHAEEFYQFLFYRQWNALKDYANGRGIKVIGDIPIFVALDSADVWCNQRLFKLNPDGSPRVVSGVPPDYFSEDGQLWGNPIYDWDAMSEDDFRWWAARVAFALRVADVARIDHFRGFAGAWEVPGADKTARNGSWVNVPGRELFDALRQHLGELPLIAEDLGVITPDVKELRDVNGFPGMKILQFAFGGDSANHDLPHNYVPNCVAYTGTHDNDTTVGWWNSTVGKGSKREKAEISREREFCMRYLNTDGAKIHWDLIRAVWGSVAHTAIAPAQDLIGVGNEGRMNLPATGSGNWSWRVEKGALTPEISARLREMTETYGRVI